MAKLEYVGKKSEKDDNICGTGVVWKGPGDVQEVPDHLVEKFLHHTDCWALAKGEKLPPVKAVAAAVARDGVKAEEIIDDPAVRIDVATFGKEQCIEAAKRLFNEDLNPKAPVAAMRARITKLLSREGAANRNVKG